MTRRKIRKGSQARAIYDSGVRGFEQAIFEIFRPISRRISETVQDATNVTIEH